MSSLSKQNLQESPRGGQFLTTPWTIVVSHARAGDTAAREQLCRLYWYPLYAYLRREGCAPHNAQDLVQGFLAALLARDGLREVARVKGRFRSFLLACLKNYQKDQWSREQAVKRGGHALIFSLDETVAEEHYRREPTDGVDPAKLYERAWAQAVLDRALARVERKFTQAGQEAVFVALAPFLRGERVAENHAQLGARFGLTEQAMRVRVHRLRAEYRQVLREEVGATVLDAPEVDEELAHLYRVLTT